MRLTFILTQVMVVSLLPPLTGVGSYNFIQLAWKEMVPRKWRKQKGSVLPGEKVTVPGHQTPRVEQCPFVEAKVLLGGEDGDIFTK